MNSTRTIDGFHALYVGIVFVIAIGLLATPALATTDESAETAPEPSFVVELDENGDAVVTVTMTYDLTDEDAQEAFDSLRDDADARENAAERFGDRVRSVASDSEERVDRSMRVTGVAIDLSTGAGGEVGVVELRVSWTGLAAVEGDRLIVTEPFASGFTTDRTFVLRGPEGYELIDATTEPDERTTASATWSAGTNLDGFDTTFEDRGESDADRSVDASDDSLPGFGTIAAILAIGAGIAIRERRG